MRFRLRLWPTLGTLLGLSMLVALGTWQFSRYQQKTEQEQARDARIDDAPVDVRSVDDLPDAYTKVRLHGTLDTDHLILFKHRTLDGKPGGWLAGVVRLDESGSVLVNLGWVHRERYDGLGTDFLADYSPPFSGVVQRPERIFADEDMRRRLSEDGLPTDTVVEADSFDIAGIQSVLDGETPSPAAVVVLGDEHAREPYPTASYAHITEPYLTAERHLSYSVFWYVTGLALLGLYLAYGFGYLGAGTVRRASTDANASG